MQLRGTTEPSLVERLSPADLTLVEGYKWEPPPKLEVYRLERRWDRQQRSFANSIQRRIYGYFRTCD
jgi:molybdopterin-guanine dinucleotide biosynthesis protein